MVWPAWKRNTIQNAQDDRRIKKDWIYQGGFSYDRKNEKIITTAIISTLLLLSVAFANTATISSKTSSNVSPNQSVKSNKKMDLEEILKILFLSLINLTFPSPGVCSNCKDLWFCEKCILRGIIKAKEKMEDCIWFQS